MKGIKRIISTFLCGVITASMFAGMTITSFAADGCWSNSPYYQQYQKKDNKTYYWDDYKYGNTSLRGSGCGIFSFCHAIKALTGSCPTPKQVADYAHEKECYGYAKGNVTINVIQETKFYNAVEEKYGQKYGFTFVDRGTHDTTISTLPNKLKTHLLNGGVAIAHLGKKSTKIQDDPSGHYICLASYRKLKNGTGQFYVIESATRFDGYGVKNGSGWVNEVTLAKQADVNGYYQYRAVYEYRLYKSTTRGESRWMTLRNGRTGLNMGVVNDSYLSNQDIRVSSRETQTDACSAGQTFLRVASGKTTYNGKQYTMYRLIPLCAPDCSVSYYNVNNKYTVRTIKTNVSDLKQRWFFESIGGYDKIHNAFDPSLVMEVNTVNNGIYLNPIKSNSLQLWEYKSVS